MNENKKPKKKALTIHGAVVEVFFDHSFYAANSFTPSGVIDLQFLLFLVSNRFLPQILSLKACLFFFFFCKSCKKRACCFKMTHLFELMSLFPPCWPNEKRLDSSASFLLLSLFLPATFTFCFFPPIAKFRWDLVGLCLTRAFWVPHRETENNLKSLCAYWWHSYSTADS